MDKTKLISTIKLLKELNYVNRCITIEELCDIAKTCLLTTEELRKEISILLGSIDYKEFGEEEEFWNAKERLNILESELRKREGY